MLPTLSQGVILEVYGKIGPSAGGMITCRGAHSSRTIQKVNCITFRRAILNRRKLLDVSHAGGIDPPCVGAIDLIGHLLDARGGVVAHRYYRPYGILPPRHCAQVKVVLQG